MSTVKDTIELNAEQFLALPSEKQMDIFTSLTDEQKMNLLITKGTSNPGILKTLINYVNDTRSSKPITKEKDPLYFAANKDHGKILIVCAKIVIFFDKDINKLLFCFLFRKFPLHYW